MTSKKYELIVHACKQTSMRIETGCSQRKSACKSHGGLEEGLTRQIGSSKRDTFRERVEGDILDRLVKFVFVKMLRTQEKRHFF